MARRHGRRCLQGLCETVVGPQPETPRYRHYGQPVAGVREAIKAAKAYLLYLPSYSPDLNPIELAFSKLKALLRKAAARSLEDLEQAIAEAIDQFSPQECANFFKHAG